MSELKSIEPAAFVSGIEADMCSTITRFSTYIERRSGVAPPEVATTPDVIIASDWEVQDPTNAIPANRIHMIASFVDDGTNPENSISYGLYLDWNKEPVYSYLLDKDNFWVSDEETWSEVSDPTMNKFIEHLEWLEAEGFMTRRS